jgi:hypothetical protein
MNDRMNESAPTGRTPSAPGDPSAAVMARPRLGGLHHRYELAA